MNTLLENSLYLISAVSENGVIGIENRLPWKLKNDLRLFKNITQGHSMLMGRKTYESLPGILPNRLHIVLTKQNLNIEKALVVNSIESAIEMSYGNLFIIGGAQIYKEALPLCSHFFRTRVHANVEGDTYFPEFNEDDWKVTYSAYYEKDYENDFAHTFELLVRK